MEGSNMPMTKKEFDHVTLLARIGLTDGEKDRFRTEINERIKQIDADFATVSTDGVDPLIRPVAADNIARDDVVVPGLGTDGAMLNAPAHEGTAFQVPRITAAGGDS